MYGGFVLFLHPLLIYALSFFSGFLALAFVCVVGVAVITAITLVMIHVKQVREKILDFVIGIL